MTHHTKDKGDIGLVKAISDLTEKGFSILTPLSEHLPFDFVAYHTENEKLYRVQSKYSTMRNNKIEVRLRTSYNSRKGCVSTRYKEGSFDVISVYCPETSIVYYLGEKMTRQNSSTLTLRVGKPRLGNNGAVCKNFRNSYDYLEFPFK